MNDDEGEVLWEADLADLAPAGEASVTTAADASESKKKRVRRIHSGDPDHRREHWEEYDAAVEGWVPLGTAEDPAFVDQGKEDEDTMLLDP